MSRIIRIISTALAIALAVFMVFIGVTLRWHWLYSISIICAMLFLGELVNLIKNKK